MKNLNLLLSTLLVLFISTAVVSKTATIRSLGNINNVINGGSYKNLLVNNGNYKPIQSKVFFTENRTTSPHINNALNPPLMYHNTKTQDPPKQAKHYGVKTNIDLKLNL